MVPYKKIVLISALLLTSLLADSGKNGLAFLKTDIGARAAAMGGAFTAVSTDAAAAYWNPAALAVSETNSLLLTHNESLLDIRQEFAAVKFISGKHNLALSLNVMNIPGIKIYGETPSDQPAGETNAVNFSAALSYASTFFDNWQLGISVKTLFEKYYIYSAGGWALDFGVYKRDLINNLDFGFTVQNIGKMSPLDQVETPLPLTVRCGFAYHLPFELFEQTPLISGDLRYINDENLYEQIGAEINIKEIFSIRGGFVFGKESMNFTTGLGINFKQYHLDYAFVPFEYDLGNTHQISFSMNF
jgi:hypothetical protein